MSRREFPENQDFLHLVGTVVNLKDSRVAVEFLDRIVIDETIAAVYLNRRRAYALAHLRGEKLGHRRLLDASHLFLLERGRVTAHLARRLDLGRHLGELE